MAQQAQYRSQYTMMPVLGFVIFERGCLTIATPLQRKELKHAAINCAECFQFIDCFMSDTADSFDLSAPISC